MCVQYGRMQTLQVMSTTVCTWRGDPSRSNPPSCSPRRTVAAPSAMERPDRAHSRPWRSPASLEYARLLCAAGPVLGVSSPVFVRPDTGSGYRRVGALVINGPAQWRSALAFRVRIRPSREDLRGLLATFWPRRDCRTLNVAGLSLLNSLHGDSRSVSTLKRLRLEGNGAGAAKFSSQCRDSPHGVRLTLGMNHWQRCLRGL